MGPLPAVGLLAGVLLTHLPVVRKPTRAEQHAPTGADPDGLSPPVEQCAHHLTVFDQQLGEGRLGPYGNAPLYEDLQERGDQGRAVGQAVLAPEHSTDGATDDPGKDPRPLSGADDQLCPGRLPGEDDDAAGEGTSHLLLPGAQLAGVEDVALQGPAPCHPAAVPRNAGVVVAVALVANETHPLAPEQIDHGRSLVEVGSSPFEGRRRRGRPDDGLEVLEPLLEGVVDPLLDHQRIVRKPDHPSRHGRRSTDEVRLFDDQSIEARGGGRDGAGEAAAAAHHQQVCQVVPLGHVLSSNVPRIVRPGSSEPSDAPATYPTPRTPRSSGDGPAGKEWLRGKFGAMADGAFPA